MWSRLRLSRLQALVATAAVLAGVAGGTNYAYWRRGAASRSTPRRPWMGVAQGPSLEYQGGLPGTEQILSLAQHLSRHPHDAPARFQLAELYFQQRDYPRSLAELSLLERDRPGDPDLFLRQAVVLKDAGQLAEAEKAVRRSLALQPRYEPAWEWLGEIYLDEQRYHQALDLFNRCLESRPHAYLALLGKGRALEQLLLTRHPIPISRVIQPVEEAVRLDPGNPEGLALLARMTFSYQQRPDDAEQLALRAAALDPRSPRPFILLAQIALSRPPTPENLERAGEFAYEAGQRDLQDPRPPYFIARVALAQNDVARAVKALERSIALGPMPEAVSLLSAAYRRAGSIERATHYAEIYQQYTDRIGRRNALLAARERAADPASSDYALAELYVGSGEPDTAEDWLKEAERGRPHDPRGDRLRAEIRQLRRQGSHGPLLPVP